MRALADLTPFDGSAVFLMTWMTVAWFFCVGASFGSLLNVIVYRVPLGLSLWRSRSRCPSCLAPIRARHNIPIFGWIGLRGRCHACGWSIPVRYPLVEAAVALLFVVLLFAEILSGGANLPGRTPDRLTGVLWTVWSPRSPELLEIYAYHLTLCYFGIGAALMTADGHGIPWGWVLFAASIGLVVPSVDPRVHTLVAREVAGFAQLTFLDRAAGVGDALLGAALGAFSGKLIQRSPRSRLLSEPAARFAMGCGLYLGVWGTLTWCLGWAVLAVIFSHARRARPINQVPALIPAGVLTLHLQILAGRVIWRELHAVWPWFGWMPT